MLQGSSHYINDNHEFASPALSASHLDTQAFESNEYTYPASPNLPATPSYNGSYQNSPYMDSNYSDLDFENNIGLLDEISGDYDPSDYDVPNAASHSGGLLTFEPGYLQSNNPHVSVSVTPPTMDTSNQYENVFDHSSPASSNGNPDVESDSRSRASSVSSNSRYFPSSPPTDVTRGFESLGFTSPRWNSSHLVGDAASPPMHKPPSPPQLVIPENSLSNEILHDRTPVINAPDGDGGLMSGPQLHIVPATPVSGGVQAAQFLNNNNNMQAPAPPTWNTETTQQNNQYDRRGYNDQNNLESNIDQYLIPQQAPRIRSKSDTSNRPPIGWEMGNIGPPSSLQRGGVNLNDILPSNSQQSMAQSSSAGSYQNSFNNGHATSPPQLANYHSYSGTDSQFLSPEMAFGAPGLRRARSDSSRSGHRYTRSEGVISYPPSAHADFIARTSSGSSMQYLHPTETLPSIRGHHRRSSSGSRDRGIPGSSAVAGFGLHSAPGSARASPYPSPNGSPSLGYDPLPSIASVPVSGMGRGRPLSLPAYGAAALGVPPAGISSLNGMGGNHGGDQAGDPNSAANIMVSKQNVTTTATAEASAIRRKNDANFVCPVPGCGSTFTRHFNLKGHLRSHNEEKPYQCKWPGCGKGFARAHDCKRHEQLHFNYRPHKCEGCGKSFQRMDALNRHLRSEGGQDCQKAQEEAQASGGINSAGLSSASTMTSGLDSAMSGFSSSGINSAPPMFGVKSEPDNWNMGVLM